MGGIAGSQAVFEIAAPALNLPVESGQQYVGADYSCYPQQQTEVGGGQHLRRINTSNDDKREENWVLLQLSAEVSHLSHLDKEKIAVIEYDKKT